MMDEEGTTTTPGLAAEIARMDAEIKAIAGKVDTIQSMMQQLITLMQQQPTTQPQAQQSLFGNVAAQQAPAYSNPPASVPAIANSGPTVEQQRIHGLRRKRLVDMYTRWNPEKVKDVDTILYQYRGKETMLFQQLEDKYGRSAIPTTISQPMAPSGMPPPMTASLFGDGPSDEELAKQRQEAAEAQRKREEAAREAARKAEVPMFQPLATTTSILFPFVFGLQEERLRLEEVERQRLEEERRLAEEERLRKEEEARIKKEVSYHYLS
jgi:hypothetical protein